ncbi:hypothetical protein RGAI101_3093 [Roseobacter sp. GAI101]|nr:hypothetical protein RGAI101_3093 [Roseobacter sp. GAI101]
MKQGGAVYAAMFFMATSAWDAGLSGLWLSGFDAKSVEVSTTVFNVSAPTAFSKKIRGP